jgi:hypothetical protein
MRQRMSRPEKPDDPPVLDPRVVAQNYRMARLRRRQRLEQTMRSRHAGVRFWAFIALLLALSAYVGITVWNQIERLFGL